MTGDPEGGGRDLPRSGLCLRCIVDLLVLPDVLLLVHVVELAYPLLTARLERSRVGLLEHTHTSFIINVLLSW